MYHKNDAGIGIKHFLGAVILLVVSSVAAQDDFFTLWQCIQQAVQHSYQLQADSALVESARNRYYTERTSYFPHIFGELAHDQLFYQPYNFRQQLVGGTLEWESGAALLGSARAAQELVRARRASQQETELYLIRRISHLYFSILQKEINIELLNTRVKLLQEHLQVSRALWKAGTRTELDVLQTRNALEIVKEKILTTEMERDNQRQELARLMNLPDYRSLHLKRYRINLDTLEKKVDWDAFHLNQYPGLQALEFRRRAQQLRQREVTATLFPSFQFRGGYQVDRDPTAEGNYWLVGVGLRFPLYQWGKSSYQRQKIQAEARELQFRENHLHRELEIQASNLRDKLQKLHHLIRLQQERLKINEKAFQYARANYQAGLITNLDYLAAQQALTENQLQITRSHLEYLRYFIDFLLLTNQMELIKSWD